MGERMLTTISWRLCERTLRLCSKRLMVHSECTAGNWFDCHVHSPAVTLPRCATLHHHIENRE